MKDIRVRFAPSPTGGLHLGGVRTILFNYLFAKQHQGKFILRIEDTDQNRYVPGAEEYIVECMEWCGLTPDESPQKGGPYLPYRQSERKATYRQYAEQLVASGHAYYAFDTPEELEAVRNKTMSETGHSSQYDALTRMKMRNSLSLPEAEWKTLIEKGTPYVIRIKMPEQEIIGFDDLIRGHVQFHTEQVDDKVLLKADGMPTYHLAVVVDDYLMKISHAFRGEEWLPSAPVHLLLWKYLGWEQDMPQWGHLPLILKPDGNGKLSKRDGDRLGFPVYAMSWADPTAGIETIGFREKGFMPEAFVNMLALLGWNDGTEKEIFSIDELIQSFSIDRVNQSGAKFDYEKAKWFNQQHILHASIERLMEVTRPFIQQHLPDIFDQRLQQFLELMRERAVLLTDFWENGSFLFEITQYEDDTIKKRWTKEKQPIFDEFTENLLALDTYNAAAIEAFTKAWMTEKGYKPGEILPVLRLLFAGTMKGPAVFDILAFIGKEEAQKRYSSSIHYFNHLLE